MYFTWVRYFTVKVKYRYPEKYSCRMSGDRAIRALEAVMPPGTPVTTIRSEGRDASVSLPGRRLLLRWLPVGWPRQLAEALRTKPRPDIVAAHQLSPGARALARQEGVGWVDESGAAEDFTKRGAL